MIQLETVKFGILKAKDTQKSAKGDNTSSCSEEDVLLPGETGSVDCAPFDDAHQRHSIIRQHHQLTPTRLSEMCTAAASVAANLKMEAMDTTSTDEHRDYHSESEEAASEGHRTASSAPSKHHNHEDAANNNNNNTTNPSRSGRGHTDKDDTDAKSSAGDELPHHMAPEGMVPPSGYLSLEALQKMAQFVQAAIANNSDNEDAQKQLAVLQSTLFTLQHQQLFQLQLIQQLQSQLSINRSEKDENEDEDEEEDEREEGELTQEQMAEEQRKYEEEQRQIRKEEEERLKAKRAKDEADGYQPLNPNAASAATDPLSAMESSFSSAFASTIITNHDQPSSMDGLNSLEMLQKRAEEVLDSASRGILSGSLTDEMSFKNDGKGRNEPFFKHRCRYCGKVFGSDSALQIHIRSHTGERPFKCNVCGSRFTTKGNLKVHFQRHTQKFPHVHMNPNPIPEHLDKFYPPILPPLPPGQQPPPSPPPPTSAPAAPRPPPAPQMNLPFPPIPGLPPGLQGFQGIPGLPMFRPPFDLLKQMGAHPFFGAMRDAIQHQDESDQDGPADLSKPVPAITPDHSTSPEPPMMEMPITTIIKEEPNDEPLSPPRSPIADQHKQAEISPEQRQTQQQHVEELIANHRRAMASASPKMWDDDKKDCISPPNKDNSPDENHYTSALLALKDQPENLSKMSNTSSKHMSSPSSVGSRERDLHYAHHMHHSNDHHNSHGEIKIFPSMMPRPGSTDNSWESYIEVDRSSETTKLQQLVDNIENKITDPNECVVCHKVLSCRSALLMHYRTHTGERPFRCKICGRAFTTKGNLKTHMSVHRMKPPMRTIHQCPVCHKKYSNSLVLQQHIRLHTGEPIDLTPEQIQAAEVRDFPSLSPGSFPMGLNPFAFPIPGMHPGMGGPESSNGDNDDFMDEDFDDASNFDENMSNTGSVSGDSAQNISRLGLSDEQHAQLQQSHARAISAMLAERSKSVENLSRAPSTNSHAESADDKCSSPRTPPQSSPAPSDVSQGALDLTPRSEVHTKYSPPMMAVTSSASTAGSSPLVPPPQHQQQQQQHTTPPTTTMSFPNFPFMPHVNATTSPMSMSNTLNSLAQSVAPMGPFNPMALAGIRGNTTCKICMKTFACQSALEIHYRSHTKERPYKCSICDKAFTTKNEELIHTSLHFQIYGNMKQHMMTHKLRDMPSHMFAGGPQHSSSSSLSPSNHQHDATNLSSSSSSLNDTASTKDTTPQTTPSSTSAVPTMSSSQQQQQQPPASHHQIRVKSESELSPRSIDCRSNASVGSNDHHHHHHHHQGSGERSSVDRSSVERRHLEMQQQLNNERHHHQHQLERERDRHERERAAATIARHDGGDRHEMLDGRSIMPPHFQADHHGAYQHVMMMAERERQMKQQSEQQQQQQQQRLKRSPSDIQQPSPKRTLVSDSHEYSASLAHKEADSARSAHSPATPTHLSLPPPMPTFHLPPHHPLNQPLIPPPPPQSMASPSSGGGAPGDEKPPASHLERLQQFHSASLLQQPIKMESQIMKATNTSPGGEMGGAGVNGDQKHYCHLCQKNFSSTSSLQIHMRTHTGERPFVCNVCQKAFTTKGNLKVHMGIHTWSGASRRGRRMSLEQPFLPMMMQSPEFMQRHSDFFHPYPPASHLLGRMQHSLNMEQQQQQLKFERGAQLPPGHQQQPLLNLAHKYMNGGAGVAHQLMAAAAAYPVEALGRQPFNSTPSPSGSDKQAASPNSSYRGGASDDQHMMDSPKRGQMSPQATTPDLSPRLWKLHYESKTMNKDGSGAGLDGKPDDLTKEELSV